ncbi:unnamed protein product [Brassica rapa]|uniref:Uncharacterized protein n=1 Tax=Brassica campestris TaxID=3711 RepID=A0A3P6AZU1_BRACM|nr:unnamed protein product [Brassica rapa]VDC93533.1 unnamed protein product [Brassica rapa]
MLVWLPTGYSLFSLFNMLASYISIMQASGTPPSSSLNANAAFEHKRSELQPKERLLRFRN